MRAWETMSCLYPSSVGLEPIRRFTFALADAARDADQTTPIPTCGEWTLDDLVWHLAEVQDFWTFVISIRPKDPKHYGPPPRTTGKRLAANLKNAAVGLTAALDRCDADEPAWSWSDDQTVGFTIRRQTHEALTHTVDGLLALGLPLPEVSPELAADGIDEIVNVMLEDAAPDPNAKRDPSAAPAPDAAPVGTVLLHATDTDDRWTVDIGTGECTIAGQALDLNLWLWGRAQTWKLSVVGDVDQAATLRAKVAADTR